MASLIVAWDTCVLVDAIQRTPDRWGSIAPMLNMAIAGDLKIVISTISVAECYWLRDAAHQGMSQDEQDALIEKWLENPYLVKRAADFGTYRIAAAIARETKGGLTPNDSIIAATALRHEAGTLVTYDDTNGESLLKQDGKLRVRSGSYLKICTPDGWSADNSAQLPFGTL